MSQDHDRRRNLERLLATYAAALGGAFLSAQGAQAEVIYTRAGPDILDNPTTPTPTTLPLDIDQDGTPDYFLELQGDASSFAFLTVSPTASPAGPTLNAVMASSYAYALEKGDRIGGSSSFYANRRTMLSMYVYSTSSTTSSFVSQFTSTRTYGYWRFLPPRYLGLKFRINGQEHFGWARISVDVASPTGSLFNIQATVLDFAYESQAGVTITADIPPVAQRALAATPHDTPVDISLTATDEDDVAGPFTFQVTSAPSHGSLNLALNTPTSNATVRYTPTTGFAGIDSFVFRATDPDGVEGPAATIQIFVATGSAVVIPTTPVIVGTSSSGGCTAVPGGDPLAAAPLGALALGAIGIRAWRTRRRRDAAAAQA